MPFDSSHVTMYPNSPNLNYYACRYRVVLVIVESNKKSQHFATSFQFFTRSMFLVVWPKYSARMTNF